MPTTLTVASPAGVRRTSMAPRKGPVSGPPPRAGPASPASSGARASSRGSKRTPGTIQPRTGARADVWDVRAAADAPVAGTPATAPARSAAIASRPIERIEGRIVAAGRRRPQLPAVGDERVVLGLAGGDEQQPAGGGHPAHPAGRVEDARAATSRQQHAAV